jgi:hypothetical protein
LTSIRDIQSLATHVRNAPIPALQSSIQAGAKCRTLEPCSNSSDGLADNTHCRRLLLLGAVINCRVLGTSSSHRLQRELMPELSHIDPGSAALLVMD